MLILFECHAASRCPPPFRRPNSPQIPTINPQGDNNWGDDRSLYPRGVRWLGRHHIMGRVIGYLPYIGQVTIIMNDYPIVKVLLIAALGLFVITSKE